MALDIFLPSKPIVSDTRQTIVDNTRVDLRALRNAIVGKMSESGATNGWTRAVSGGTSEEPGVIKWTNSGTAGGTTEKVRATITWTSGFITTIVWEWTENNEGAWTTIGTETAVYDGSNNMTTGNHSTMFGWLWEWMGKLKALRTLYNAHAAATGTAVHGLGTMSTQAASAVAVTGGTLNGVTIGGTTAAEPSRAKSWRETHVAVTFQSGVGATTTLDAAAGSSFDFTATGSGASTLAISNPPTSGWATTIILWITNGALRTWTWPTGTKWANATAPTLTTSGLDLLSFTTRDGGTTWHGTLVSKDSR
jgi:hypothetical protein